MSKFNIDLEQARKKQGRLYLTIGAGMVVLSLVIILPLFLVYGTHIDISPQEASDRAQLRTTTGAAVAIGHRLYSFGGRIGLEITAHGYLPAKLSIDVTDKSGFVEVRLVEAPGRLEAITIPKLATTNWHMDGKFVSTSPGLSVHLKSGEHSLTVDNPYFEKVTQSVAIKKGEHTNLKIELKPVVGRVILNSTPAGAEITLNGQPMGTTPRRLKLTGGSYSVELNHRDRKKHSDMIEITNTHPNLDRSYQLLFEDAFVKFDLSPPNGMLLLNGRRLDNHNQARVDALKNHTVTYMKGGYFAQTKELQLRPNEERALAFRLKEELGRVSISSKPPARISINGKELGQTPVTLSLPVLTHDLVIFKDGYRTYKQKLLPSSKTPKQVDVTLKTELQARLEENPEVYKNSVGLTMRRYYPNQFEMGAPRSQKGQRANEFQRTIRLSKPIYVSVYEVTVQQFSKFRRTKSADSASNLPVTNVSWLDAVAYCNWLSRQEKLEPFYILKNGQYRGINRQADGYRLLTEAEWEWLARKAGRRTTTIFTWGDNYIIPPSSGNFADESAKGIVDLYIPHYDDGHPGLAEVGKFGPDKAGLFDISGNASEWVHDFYSVVPPEGQRVEVEPFGPGHGDSHVVKGSNWRSGSLTEIRAAFRDGVIDRRDDLGFRVVRFLYGKDDPTN